MGDGMTYRRRKLTWSPPVRDPQTRYGIRTLVRALPFLLRGDTVVLGLEAKTSRDGSGLVFDGPGLNHRGKTRGLFMHGVKITPQDLPNTYENQPDWHNRDRGPEWDGQWFRVPGVAVGRSWREGFPHTHGDTLGDSRP